MKTVKSYISGLAAAMAVAAGFTACQNDFDTPMVEVPVAVNQANTTIAELKAAYWQDTANYADSVGVREDGSHYIIKGRVISSDEQSNVFKFITIQDETGAINFSVNSYNLYLNYRRGQEIVVDATDMYIGKYAGLQQFGTPSYYENGSTWQVGFMSPQFFRQHIELNGLPDVAELDTITVNSFSEFLSSAPEDLRKWQSQLVRINNVHFQDGGVKTFSAYHSNDNDDVNRTLVDADGNSQVVVRTSGYATFWNKMLPAGNGDIVGILSYYQNLAGATTWQLILNDYEGCMNFGNPTIAPGTEGNPYSVAEVVKLETDGTPANGWVSGYIVGSVNPTENNLITNEDINWGSETLMPYTLVIGADKETKDLASALVIELPADSPLRQYGNLRDNPDNYGKKISVRGTFDKVMGTYGVTDNSGAASQFKIEGVQTGPEAVPEGDGTADKPYNASQAKAKAIENGTSSTDNVYVKGYIIDGSINMTYGTGTWTIANNPDGTGETFTLYGTYNTDNGKFTDENAVKVGDLVVAVGPIYNYNGKTPEMSKGHLVSINAGGSGDEPGVGSGDGTAEKPYTASQAKAKAIANGTSSSDNVYVKGYIISGEINMTYGTGTWVIADNAQGTGDTFTLYGTYNTDNKKFTDDTAVKVGDLVVAVGPIYNYNGKTPEMSKGHLVSINGDGGTVTPGPAPDDPAASGSGTESDPYNCAGLIALNPTDKNTNVATDVWVKGYIIGYMPSNGTIPANTITNAENCQVATNIVLAPTAAETDFSKCVPIQLPTETNAPGIRSALNLQNNPGNLGKEVLLKGNVTLYCGAPGLKDTKAYKFVDGGGTTPGPDDPVVGDGDGTADKPYTASQAKAQAIANGTSSTDNVYVKGYIISGSIDTNYGNGTWVIADNKEGTGATFTLFRLKNVGDVKFTDANAVKVGDLVVALGPIYNYSGTTPEMGMGHLVSINGNGGTVTPDPGPGTGDDPVASGAGTKSDPYNCAGLIALNPTDKNTNVATGVWVKGYIIGYMPSNGTVPANTITNAENCQVATNIVLAPTAAETDFSKCVPIQLPTETNAPGIRSALNLQNNPGNLGKEVLLKGNVTLYCGAPGLKETSEYEILGSTPDPGPGTGDDPVTPPVAGDPVTIQAADIQPSGTTTVDGYTFVVSKANGTSNPMISGTSLRLYADNTIQIKGKRVVSITFSIASTNKKRYTTVTPSKGDISPAQAAGDTSFTWVGDASDVTFTVGAKATLGTDGESSAGQIHITSITITPAK